MTKKLLLYLSFFIIACNSEPSFEKAQKNTNISSTKYSSEINQSILKDFTYSSLNENPNNKWVGKFLKIKFAKIGGVSINGKTKIIFVKSFEKDSEGYRYFEIKDLSDDYLSEVYTFWFKNKQFGPSIISWEEAFPKKKIANLQTKVEIHPPKGKKDDKGNRVGKWIFYHHNGEIKYIQEYLFALSYREIPRENSNDVEHGKWLSFSEDGKLLAKGFFKEGLKDGKWITSYHPNGKVHIEEFFRDGRNIGSINIYDVDGNFVDLNYYSNYDYYASFNGNFHDELDRMARMAESIGIYNHNVDAYHRALDAGDRNDIDAFIKALYDIEPNLDLDF